MQHNWLAALNFAWKCPFKVLCCHWLPKIMQRNIMLNLLLACLNWNLEEMPKGINFSLIFLVYFSGPTFCHHLLGPFQGFLVMGQRLHMSTMLNYLLTWSTWNIGKAPKQINILTWNLGMYLSGVSLFHHHWWRGLRQLDRQTQLGNIIYFFSKHNLFLLFFGLSPF
jgi:hypothetical protein